jgi:hypothetical protein
VLRLYMRHIMRQSHTAPAGKSNYLLRGINRYRILRAELRRGVERYQTANEIREELLDRRLS